MIDYKIIESGKIKRYHYSDNKHIEHYTGNYYQYWLINDRCGILFKKINKEIFYN